MLTQQLATSPLTCAVWLATAFAFVYLTVITDGLITRVAARVAARVFALAKLFPCGFLLPGKLDSIAQRFATLVPELHSRLFGFPHVFFVLLLGLVLVIAP